MGFSYRTIGLWLILVVLFVAFYNFFSRGDDDIKEPTFTQFLSKVEDKKVLGVSIKGNVYSGTFTDTKEKFRTAGPPGDIAMMQKLREQGVEVRYETEQQNSIWLTILNQWMPVALLVLFLKRKA